MTRNLVYIGIAIVLVLVIAGVYMYNLGHKNLANIEPDFRIEAVQLQSEISENEAAALEKYQDKILEISGRLIKIEENQDSSFNILLETSDPLSFINASLDISENSRLENLEEGKNVTIRGQFSGILMDIMLKNCVIISDN